MKRRLLAAPGRALLSAAFIVAALLRPAAAGETAACPALPSPPRAEQAMQLRHDAIDHGFLWRISRDGHSSYLYGTLHLGRLEWIYPGPALRQAWDDTDLLALELDLSDPATAAQMQAALRDAPAPALSARRKARLQRQLERQCAPADAPSHPVMQAMTLSLLAARRDGLEPFFAQEAMLIAMAHEGGRDIEALETPARQLQALLPRNPAEALAMFDRSLQQLEDDSGRAVMRRLADVWARGALDELDRYEAWCDCATTPSDRALLARLNDERNPQLARHIARLHAQGHRVLAAVGALHMTGPKGLPRLLEQLGFDVRREAATR